MCPSSSVPHTWLNAFILLMEAQRVLQFANNGIPSKKTERTQKDRLFNDIIDFLERSGLIPFTVLPSSKRYATYFGTSMGITVYFLKGCSSIPEALHYFIEYNILEKSKHRKRKLENLSATELRSGAMSLQECLQASWVQKCHFNQLH